MNNGKNLVLVFLVLACSSCYIRIGERKAPTQDYLILDAYSVDNGIGDRYIPCEMAICSDDVWVLSVWNMTDSCNTFFLSVDNGVNWEMLSSLDKKWTCENMLVDNDIIYCSALNQDRIGKTTVNAGKIFRSIDYGESWEELFVFDAYVEHMMVVDSSLAVQLCSVTEVDGKDVYDVEHTIQISNDLGKTWRGYTFGNFYVSSFSSDKITVAVGGRRESILEIIPERQIIDTISSDSKMITNVVRGDDIVGLTNGGSADYFRIIDGVANFYSRIQYGGPFVNHTPVRIYQYDSIVFTKVLVPGLNSTSKMFASTDRARTWTQVSAKSEIDNQLDSVWTPEGNAWFMAGYKDRMVSYCVGYKDGKRQDFIKVIRPKR